MQLLLASYEKRHESHFHVASILCLVSPLMNCRGVPKFSTEHPCETPLTLRHQRIALFRHHQLSFLPATRRPAALLRSCTDIGKLNPKALGVSDINALPAFTKPFSSFELPATCALRR